VINLEEIFNKLRNGEALEEIEIDVLEKLLFELDHLYNQEWKLAEAALQEMVYYKRLAKIRKHK
jgi:hypothetical protein